MNAFVYHFLFEFRTSIRKRSILAVNYLLPLGLYAMMGLTIAPINPDFLETMIPSMVGVAVMSATILSLPEPLVTAREAGIFRSYKINGVPAFSILVIPALVTIIPVVVVTIIIAVTAPLFFNAPIPVNWPGFVITMFMMFFACSGLGVLISVISPSSQMAVFWSNVVFIPSMILSGVTGLPMTMLPVAIRRMSQLLPATHGMNAFRGIAQNLSADFDQVSSVIVLMMSGVLAFVLAIYLFNWDRHNTTQRGHPLFALIVLLPYIPSMFLSS